MVVLHIKSQTKYIAEAKTIHNQICVTSVPMRINIESGVSYAAGIVTAPPCSPNTRKEARWETAFKGAGLAQPMQRMGGDGIKTDSVFSVSVCN